MTATFFFLAGLIFKSNLSKELMTTSKWCLWGAGIAAFIAAIFGLLVYNSVAHDEPSHAAMTLHRNWAIPTAVFIALLAIYAYAIKDVWGRKRKGIIIISLISASLLTSITGWLGGEAVYRYGIGVMRIPNTDSHQHSEPTEHDDALQYVQDDTKKIKTSSHGKNNHAH